MRSRIYSYPTKISSRESFNSVRFLADMLGQSVEKDSPDASAVLICVNLPTDQADQLGKMVLSFVASLSKGVTT